jgi:hypothetical protein
MGTHIIRPTHTHTHYTLHTPRCYIIDSPRRLLLLLLFFFFFINSCSSFAPYWSLLFSRSLAGWMDGYSTVDEQFCAGSWNGSFRVDALFSFPFDMGTDPARAYTEKHVGVVCVVIPQVYYTPQIKKYMYAHRSLIQARRMLNCIIQRLPLIGHLIHPWIETVAIAKRKKRATILEIEDTRQSWQKKLDDDANLRSFLRNLFFLFNQRFINLDGEKRFWPVEYTTLCTVSQTVYVLLSFINLVSRSRKKKITPSTCCNPMYTTESIRTNHQLMRDSPQVSFPFVQEYLKVNRPGTSSLFIFLFPFFTDVMWQLFAFSREHQHVCLIRMMKKSRREKRW